MNECIEELEGALRTARKHAPWSADIKASDDFLEPLFENYYERLGINDPLLKRDFYQLVKYCGPADIDPEVTEKLDLIQILLAGSDRESV
jgi:hypothetical protein